MLSVMQKIWIEQMDDYFAVCKNCACKLNNAWDVQIDWRCKVVVETTLQRPRSNQKSSNLGSNKESGQGKILTAIS